MSNWFSNFRVSAKFVFGGVLLASEPVPPLPRAGARARRRRARPAHGDPARHGDARCRRPHDAARPARGARDPRGPDRRDVEPHRAGDQGRAFALGANDYLVELPDPLELVARIRYHSRAYTTALDARDAWEAVVESQRQLEARNRFIRKTFGRYLSDEIVASLLETQEGLHLGGEARRVTILMADLRGFTPMCELLAPAQVVTLLNHYLGTMSDLVADHGGAVDEFIGDAVLAVFGAPILHADDALRAATCAVAMAGINARNQAAGLPVVEMGIGLGIGEVVVGNIGSERRAKYGVVGGRVNLTSRIAATAAGGQILASEATILDAGTAVRCKGPTQVTLKGVTGHVAIYEVSDVGRPR